VSQKDSWEELAVAGDSDWREERYQQAVTTLGRASDLALAKVDLSLLSEYPRRYRHRYNLPPKLKDPAEEFDTRWLSRLARVLILLGGCRHHIGESGSAETAFQRSLVVINYLIEQRLSEILGEIEAFADLLRRCGRTDLADAIIDHMGAKVLETLG
jgi:hypothetical protein